MTLQQHVGRPLRELLALLPRLELGANGQVDFDGSAPELLVQIAEAAEHLQRVFTLGSSSVGQLMALTSADIDSGDIGQDALEALGWLLAELGDGAEACASLAGPCRHATADFTGRRDDEAQ